MCRNAIMTSLIRSFHCESTVLSNRIQFSLFQIYHSLKLALQGWKISFQSLRSKRYFKFEFLINVLRYHQIKQHQITVLYLEV